MKIRKIKYKSHKNFGCHRRIVDGEYVKPSDAGGRSVGSKQILPGEYPAHTRQRTKSELKNQSDRDEK